MSAPTLSKKQIQQTIRKGNSRQVVKTVLSNPYTIPWPTVLDDVQEEILQRLLSTLKSLGIARPKSCKRRKKTKTEDTKIDTATALPVDKERQDIRKQLLFGVNQVTRGLEKDEVRLVITCRSAQPVIITRHLIGLAALRKCPAICISNLNKSVCQVMNMTSTVAIGFKKTSGIEDLSVFDDLVEFIAKHIPDISLPWLPGNSADIANVETPLEEMDTSAEVCSQNAVNEVESSAKTVKTESPANNLSFDECSDQDVKEMSKEPVSYSNVEDSSRQDSIDNVKSQGMKAETVDYSHFYVYKSEAAKSIKKWPEFLKFSSDPEESVDYRNMSVQRNPADPNQESVGYEKVSLKRMPGNPNRKKRKRNLKI